MEIPRLRGVIGGPARSPPDDQEYNDERHEVEIHDDDDHGDDGYKNRLDKHENDNNNDDHDVCRPGQLACQEYMMKTMMSITMRMTNIR